VARAMHKIISSRQNIGLSACGRDNGPCFGSASKQNLINISKLIEQRVLFHQQMVAQDKQTVNVRNHAKLNTQINQGKVNDRENPQKITIRMRLDNIPG
jgi:hypothetical protein